MMMLQNVNEVKQKSAPAFSLRHLAKPPIDVTMSAVKF